MCVTITAITITPIRVTITITTTTMISITLTISTVLGYLTRQDQDILLTRETLLITKCVYYTIPIPNDNSSNMSKSITISLKIMMTSGFSLTMSIVLGYLTRQEKYIFAWLSRGYESLHINAGTSTG